jgi:cytochrome b
LVFCHYGIVMNQDKSTDQSQTNPPEVNVWDLPTRTFHWLLVISFAVAYFSNLLGVSYFVYHLWSGYFVILLLVFRLCWGVIGAHHSRFINFVPNPKETIRYLRDLVKGKSKSYQGHNPLGAWMVLLLLVSLLIQAITGLFSNDEIFNAGPLYAYVSHEISLWLTGIHKDLFYWIFAAVVLHVLAVFFYLIIKRENLIKPMITGKKLADDHSNINPVKSASPWLALLLIVIISAVLAWIIVSAPEVSIELGY